MGRCHMKYDIRIASCTQYPWAFQMNTYSTQKELFAVVGDVL